MPRWLDRLPAGPSTKLRVQAEVSGPAAPKSPDWKWTVLHVNSKTDVKTSSVQMNPAVVEFSLAAGAGQYLITASATAKCAEHVTATAVDDPFARFWLRVTPPVGGPVAPIEGTIVDVPTGRSVNRNLSLGVGEPVSIDPQTLDGSAVIVSYVRITAAGSTFRFEGHTQAGQLMARLDPILSYNVLVIPEKMVAPQLFSGTAARLGQTRFRMDPGVPVSGRVSGARGPVTGARVLLRAGQVPSTTGVTKANGDFDLMVRPGNFQAAIIPPSGAGLPEARISAGNGLVIYDPPPARVTLDFEWAAFETTTLELNMRTSQGLPVTGPVRVHLESEPGTLPDAGTLTIDKKFPLPTTGFVQRDGSSDARGALTFPDLPRGRYTAILTPPDGSAAITTVSVDLTAPMARVTQTVMLAAKVTLAGKLSPFNLTANGTVVALDTVTDPTVPTPSAVVSATGQYSLSLAPGRTYSLMLEGVPARGVPRTFLGTFVASNKDSVLDEMMVLPGLEVSGTLNDSIGGRVGGALVEAYCTGLPPACVDPRAPDVSGLRPIAEAVSDQDGNYRLLVPDPKVAY